MQNKTLSFGNFHPLTLMIWFVSIFIFSMFSANPVIMILSFTGAVCLFISVCGVRAFWKDLPFYLILFLLIALSNPLFTHNGETPLFFFNNKAVTLEAIYYGLETALMLLAVIYWFKCYNAIMTTEKFIYLFGRIIPRLALVISMALRLLPMFIRRFRHINDVQKTIGLYTKKGTMHQIKASAKVFGALISHALENSIDTGCSMLARGYGLSGRSSFSIYRFTPSDAVLILTDLLLCGVVTGVMAAGGTRFYFYPAIRYEWNAWSYIAFAAFALLSFLPFIIETKEKLLWKYSISRI